MAAAAPSPEAPALSLRGLGFAYGHATAPIRFPDIALPAGKHLLVLGPSGCGKSTLLHLVAGLLTPTAGEVEVAGQPLASLRGARLDRFRGERIGLVYQRLHLLPALSVLDNLLLAQYLAGRRRDRTRALALLERLGLAGRADSRPEALSFGQAQRAALARAVINSPSLILADEPTSNLDDANTAEVLALLQQEAETSGASLLIATHDRRLQSTFARQLELAP